MAELRIRDLDGWIVETFRALAKRKGHSMEAEIKDVLRSQAMGPREALARELLGMNDELKTKYGLLPDSTDLIRKDRESRG
ncbi:MAG TPA: hypothetical protein VHR66_31740 [Gemmataceae bacterium]|jgi:plasmid stability protein|nr:hypothetical protein [Gemmataceae bacterium]